MKPREGGSFKQISRFDNIAFGQKWVRSCWAKGLYAEEVEHINTVLDVIRKEISVVTPFKDSKYSCISEKEIFNMGIHIVTCWEVQKTNRYTWFICELWCVYLMVWGGERNKKHARLLLLCCCTCAMDGAVVYWYNWCCIVRVSKVEVDYYYYWILRTCNVSEIVINQLSLK